MLLLRFIKRLQDFLDESSVEDKQKWDDEFHDLEQTLPFLSERSSPDSLPQSTSSETKKFGMQAASDDDLLEAGLPKVTPAVQTKTEPPPKIQLSSMEVPPKPLYVKKQAQSSSLHPHRKLPAPTGRKYKAKEKNLLLYL